jgi:hypothetical protein
VADKPSLRDSDYKFHSAKMESMNLCLPLCLGSILRKPGPGIASVGSVLWEWTYKVLRVGHRGVMGIILL